MTNIVPKKKKKNQVVEMVEIHGSIDESTRYPAKSAWLLNFELS